MTTGPRLTPEAEHLAEQERLLEELTEHLTAKEAEFAEAGSAFARFRAEYLRRFAPLYTELDRLEAEIARQIAQEEATPTAHAKAADAATRADESQCLPWDALPALAACHLHPAGGCLTRSWQKGVRAGATGRTKSAWEPGTPLGLRRRPSSRRPSQRTGERVGRNP